LALFVVFQYLRLSKGFFCSVVSSPFHHGTLLSLDASLPGLSTLNDVSQAAVIAEVSLCVTSPILVQFLTFCLRALSHSMRLCGFVQHLKFLTRFFS
jgi:hypothetical protein